LVYKGVTNNIPLLRDIITEERFVSGDISTKYLPQVYPEGFKGKQLNDTERESLVALAACVATKSAIRDRSFKQQQSKLTTPKNYQYEVKINDFKRKINVTPIEHEGVKQFEVCFVVKIDRFL
jgi:propionyl-CoA carboxylase alpha chain